VQTTTTSSADVLVCMPSERPQQLLSPLLEELDRDAWRVVFAYARRWQIEMAFRFDQTELAMQSPRLWARENRVELFLMVSLACAFLLHLLAPEWKSLRPAWKHMPGPDPAVPDRREVYHICSSPSEPLFVG
jgi:hypothetical protein